LKKSGKIQLYTAREVQEKLITLYSGELNSGKHKIAIDISRLSKEFHYLLFFYEGKLAHFQEVDLR